MTTEVIITGTGIPLPVPGRAGPGVLVRSGDVALQFDAGRNTVGRLSEIGVLPIALDALFLTHHHSDHVSGVADLALTRWIVDDRDDGVGPLTIHAPNGPATDFAGAMLGPFHADIAVRTANVHRIDHPEPQVIGFDPTDEPRVIFAMGGVSVSAFNVDHRPVVPAVGYRITTNDASIVISGDTRVCDTLERAAYAADLLVHEVVRLDALRALGRPESWVRAVADYHADAVALGAMAERAEVGHLVLTHYVPSPTTDEELQAFVTDVRRGGYEGIVSPANDLDRFVP